mgnify:CR=1 FL=1
MKKLYFLLFTLLITSVSYGQFVINEIDADTPGTDIAEFIELKGAPNSDLTGYSVVLFNGSDDLSYDAFDLDGFSTDANGFFVLANTSIWVAGDLEVPPGGSGAIQNGADAVALYQDDASNFPNDTAITMTNLIDAVVYDTNDSDDSGLLAGFGLSIQYNEDGNGSKDTHSLQRQNDGTYEALTTTIRAENNVPTGPMQVADLAALRADVIANGAGGQYEVLSTPTVTYTRTSRNQKYIQDGTAGILIDDNAGTITTTFNEGDGITGLLGTASLYNGVLQFVPLQDATVLAGAPVTPEVITITMLLANQEDYESQLVRINGVSFADAGSTFATGTDYIISDGSDTVFRTNFSEADYVVGASTIPSGSNNISVLVGEFNGAPQVTARTLSELTLSIRNERIQGLSFSPNPTSLGYVNISSRSQVAMKVNVYDVLGKQIINTQMNSEKLDVSKLTSGVYFMKITQGKAISTKKLVIN